MTTQSKDPYYNLKTAAPHIFGYYSAIHFSQDMSETNPKRRLPQLESSAELRHHTLTSGAVLTASSSGVISVDLSSDINFKSAIFPSRAEQQTKKGQNIYDQEKEKNSQNRRLARLILRAHQAFVESAIHYTGSGGAKANSIDSFDDIADVHSQDDLLRHARFKRQFTETSYFNDMPWRVAQVAFQELDTAFRTGGLDLLKLVELYQVSSRRFETHEYEQVIFLSWMVCEPILEQLWKKHIEVTFEDNGRGADLSKTRLANLSKISDAAMMELLEAYGLISSKSLKEIKILRGVRNAVAHELSAATLQQANQAISCIKDLIREVYSVGLTIMIPHPESHGGRWVR